MARKPKTKKEDADSADENVEAYKYETDTRKNAVPAGPPSYDTSRPNPILSQEICDAVRHISPRNQVRDRVSLWRKRDYSGITKTSWHDRIGAMVCKRIMKAEV